MKTAAQAISKYGTNGASIAAQNLWAQNYSANIPAILDAAAAASGTWQANVSTTQAATNFKNGLAKAKANSAQIATKVNGVGKASFGAGVTAAAAPTGDYTTFANAWMPAVQAEVNTLNTTNPRGTLQQNRARQAAYDQWVDSQAGKFRVK